MAHSLPVFPKFEINGDSTTTGHSTSVNWKNLFVAMNIDSRKRKKSLTSSLCWR